MYEDGIGIKEISQILGLKGNFAVHAILKNDPKYKPRRPKLQKELKDFIKSRYEHVGFREPIDLKSIGNDIFTIFGRKINRQNIGREARRMGLTSRFRKQSEKTREDLSKIRRKWHQNHSHPRGMSGKKHTEEVKHRIGIASKKQWKNMSQEKLLQRSIKQIKTALKNKTLIPSNRRRTWKSGWREVAGSKFFFRSRWEYNYALFLESEVGLGNIAKWEYEPKTFLFEKIIRGTRTYTPDFLVHFLDGSYEYREIKGWYDSRSRTQQRRMKLYFPKEKVVLINSEAYKAFQKQYQGILRGWEG